MKNLLISCLICVASVLSLSALADKGAAGAEPAQQANLIIYRPADRSAMNYRILVNGKYMGKLKRDSAIKLRMNAGEHVIAASDPKRTRLVVNVDKQGVTYIRSDIDRKSRLSLVVTEPADSVVSRFAGSKDVTLFN